MFNYFIDLLQKPIYQWSILDDFALFGLVMVILAIVIVIWYIIWAILEKIREYKFHNCEGIRNTHTCIDHEDCLNCIHYKKKGCNKQKADEVEDD